MKFTLHNESGDYMSDGASTLSEAINKADKVSYKCRVCETYKAPSPWNKTKITDHLKTVYENKRLRCAD